MKRDEQFDDLYRSYRILVYNVALNHVQNVEDAEEITQDVFVKAYYGMEKFNQQSALKTWMYQITVNACLDFIKHKQSKKRFFIYGNRGELEHNAAKVFEHPGILLEHQENARILFEAINSLPDNQKTAFLFSKVDGLSNAEISAIMQTTISAVESLIFRAKSTLREKLAQNFETFRKKK